MFKKVVSIVATIFLTSVVLSNVAMANSNEVTFQASHSQNQNKGQNHGQSKKEENKNKSYMNQLNSVDKRLTKIEEIMIRYETKFNKMELDDEDGEDKDDEDIQVIEDTEESQSSDEESGVNENRSEGESTINEEEAIAPDAEGAKDEPIEEADKNAEEVALEESEEVEELAEEESEEAEERAEDIAEELEDAIKEHTDYNGKIKSLENQLNSVKKKLEALAEQGVDNTLIVERVNRIVALQQKLADSATKIGQIQEKVIEKIKNDKDAEEKALVTEENTIKPWNIKFSKKLDEKTLSELVIIVHDEQNNLVETTTMYTDSAKTVTVTPLQPYKTGSTYTLYIGKELSSADGEGLKNSVKMKFTIK